MPDKFPSDRVNSKVIDSPIGPSRVTCLGRGFPCLGIMQQHVPWCVLEDGFVFDPFDIYGSRSVPLDIARRAHALVLFLKFFGINGIEHADIKPECVEDWSKDYAIIENYYSPWGEETEGHYFDGEQCRYDLEKTIKDFFLMDPSVKLEFYRGKDELEITR